MCSAVIFILFTACTGGIDKHKAENHKMNIHTEMSKGKFEGIQFTSKKDTICGMPITPKTAVDTLILDGKIYGFCATECKEEFADKLVKEHKR